MTGITLVFMPFSSAWQPAVGLSMLKSSCLAHGLRCDIKYLNMRYRNYVNSSLNYDQVCEYWPLGEWVFGAELFGPEWGSRGRGNQQNLASFLSEQVKGPVLNSLTCALHLSASKPGDLTKKLVRLRGAAGPFLEECLQTINWSDYSIIGFTTTGSQQVAALALARKLKERWPDKVIVFGGPDCEGEMGQTLLQQFPFVDWVFSGEADFAFPRAVQQLASGETLDGIPGLMYRAKGAIKEQGYAQVENLDELPFPDYTDYFAAVRQQAPDVEENVEIFLEYSRGCWSAERSQCIFCGLNGHNISYRCKSPRRALEETRQVVSRHSAVKVALADTNLPLHYFDQVLPFLAPLDLSGFFVETRSNLNRHQLWQLKQAGTTLFQPGVESLATEMLRYMNKGTDLLDNLQGLKWAWEYGLQPKWNFLHSFPGENPAAYSRMEGLIPLLFHLQPPVNIQPVFLQRYSPLFRDPERWKLQNVRAAEIYSLIFPFEQPILDNLAYSFDFTVGKAPEKKEGSNPRESSKRVHASSVSTIFSTSNRSFTQGASTPELEAVLELLQSWKQSWERNDPPVLGLAKEGGNTFVYDTRPARVNSRTLLTPLQNLILEACDKGQSFAAIGQALAAQNSGKAPGDQALRGELQTLKDLKFIISDGEKYLSLVNNMDYLVRYSPSITAYLLYGQ